jgi:hypothetical protein
VSLEDGLASVAGGIAELLEKKAAAEKAKKLLTDAYLLTGLRVRRSVAAQVFRGVRVMHESSREVTL